jgi:hypothetical protein
MKEEIRKEVMKVFNQEDSVDNVVNNILRLFDVSGRSEQLCQWHDWVKHPSHPKIGAMICRNCRTELA